MKNKSDKGNGQTKGKPAIRSAGNQTTGNCNKQMLVAERGRTDKANGRLNKQNPVGSQKMNSMNQSDEQAKNAGYDKFYKILSKMDGTLYDIMNKLSGDEEMEIWDACYDARTYLEKARWKIRKLQ